MTKRLAWHVCLSIQPIGSLTYSLGAAVAGSKTLPIDAVISATDPYCGTVTFEGQLRFVQQPVRPYDNDRVS
jgi:ABC-type uncharacterized transport system ATPase subunit